MEYVIKDARFIRISDVSYMYEIQKNGDSIQQHKKAFFVLALKTEKGEGTFILHAAYSKEKEWTRFLIEHERMQETCCVCSIPYEEAEVYCFGFTQETLRSLFEDVQHHPHVNRKWEEAQKQLE